LFGILISFSLEVVASQLVGLAGLFSLDEPLGASVAAQCILPEGGPDALIWGLAP
jgi:hypothetical protein